MTRSTLTRREAIDFLGDYVSGELTLDVRARFEDHVAACPECLAYLERYAETIQLAKTTRGAEDEVRPEMPEELVQAILAARRVARRPSAGRRRRS